MTRDYRSLQNEVNVTEHRYTYAGPHGMSDFLFDLAVVVAGIAAGGVASVAGFGIGSLLTPVFVTQVATQIAVAAVSIPHVVGTAARFWLLRGQVDRRLLVRFGLTSAAGGLAGALLQARTSSAGLTIVFGSLLLFVAASELTGLSKRMRFRGAAAWIAGALSGLLGGLVGNQGGIRSAAMLGVDVPRQAFVGTATAVALIVDGARLPVYLATTGDELLALWPTIAFATIGVVCGTLFGHRVLMRIPEERFRPTVATLLAILGAAMLFVGLAH
jgi:uncharacterized membrane protein YfcA